jgi:hypothetical protein
LDILNASDLSLAKTIPTVQLGFAKAMDGSIWAAGGTNDSMLIKIDPTTLDTTNVALPFEVNGSLYYWHPGSITASTKENAIFLAYNGAYAGGTTIYKYTVGSSAFPTTPFINIGSANALYGAGVAYDHQNDQLVVTSVQSANYGANDLAFYAALTGVSITDQSYSGFFFPAIPFFH